METGTCVLTTMLIASAPTMVLHEKGTCGLRLRLRLHRRLCIHAERRPLNDDRNVGKLAHDNFEDLSLANAGGPSQQEARLGRLPGWRLEQMWPRILLSVAGTFSTLPASSATQKLRGSPIEGSVADSRL